MRPAKAIGATLLALAVAVLIGVTAFHAGAAHGVAQASHGQVIRVVGPGFGWGFFGFFPFGLLFFFGLWFLMRGLFWRRRWGGPGGPGGAQWEERRRRMEEWHRRQHERDTSDHFGAGG